MHLCIFLVFIIFYWTFFASFVASFCIFLVMIRFYECGLTINIYMDFIQFETDIMSFIFGDKKMQ